MEKKGPIGYFFYFEAASSAQISARQATVTWHSCWRQVSRRTSFIPVCTTSSIIALIIDICRVVRLLRESVLWRSSFVSEDSVEYDELDVFLRLKESWNPDVDEHIAPPVQPIGVPGAAMPLDMTPERLRDKVKAQPTSSSLADKKPIPVNKREGELDLGDELSGFGLQGLKITGDELRDLIAELGMDGDDAGDLLKGLGGEAEDEKEAENDEREASPSPEEKPAKEKKSEEAKK